MTTEVIEDWDEYLRRSKLFFRHRYVSPKPETLTKSDLQFFKTIGQGSFGVVVVAKHILSDSVYAVKVLAKKQLVTCRMVDQTLEEKRISCAVKFPLIIRMEHFFMDNSYLYFVLPFIPGGELFAVLRKAGRFEESKAVFYAAQVVLALEYLHNVNVIYRDLKPENILLHCEGYIKLTDLGFAKVVCSRTYTLCGTADYLAPEIIMSRGYGLGVDWWALGVLAFEMCSGTPPFFSKTASETFRHITDRTYHCPRFFSPDLVSLLNQLLETDTYRRLGCLKNGVLDIKNHSWFIGVVWLDVVNKRVRPPYLPSVRYEGDTTNFEAFEDFKPGISDVDLYAKEFEQF